MSKTITIRLEEEDYWTIKRAADSERRTISNFIEYATLHFIEDSTFMSHEEMKDLTDNKKFIKNLKSSLKDIEKGETSGEE